jgi:hypothetical protein
MPIVKPQVGKPREVLNFLGNWCGASFARESANGLAPSRHNVLSVQDLMDIDLLSQ